MNDKDKVFLDFLDKAIDELDEIYCQLYALKAFINISLNLENFNEVSDSD